MIPKSPLLLLLPLASALNNVIIPLPYPECNTCVDSAVNSCPGDYETRAYANCLCAGDGGPRIVNCVSTRCPWPPATRSPGGGTRTASCSFPSCAPRPSFMCSRSGSRRSAGRGRRRGWGLGRMGIRRGIRGAGGVLGVVQGLVGVGVTVGAVQVVAVVRVLREGKSSLLDLDRHGN